MGARKRVWVATVLVSVLAVASVVALAARMASPGSALLSVADMEKEDKLRHALSEKLASEELAHWNRINAAAFPTTAEVEAHATRRAAPGAWAKVAERARMEQALSDKGIMAQALKQQAKMDQRQLQHMYLEYLARNHHQAAAKTKQTDAKAAGPKAAAASPKKTQPKAKTTAKATQAQLAAAPTQKKLVSATAPLETSGPSPAVQAGSRNMDSLGDDVMDVPVHGPTDDGDVHVAADDVTNSRYMFFKQKKGQKLFLGEGPWVHVPVEREMSGDGVGQNFDGASGVVVDSDPWTKEAQVRVNPANPPCSYLSQGAMVQGHPGLTDGDCDETIGRDMDIEGHAWPDNYPASYDAVSGNNHGLYKSNQVQQLRALPRQRLFLGEGPWAHVPVEHEMSGDGVGKNFEGANGVIVDSDPWSKEAQLRVNGAQPPCMYRCASPSGWCEGHPGLADGDCEEVLGLENDIIHTPQHHVEYPATYDAWSGNTNGFFKAPGPRPSLHAMAAAQFRAQEASDNEPAGLAALAQPKHPVVTQARRAPGLGSLAPTVRMDRLRQLQMHQQMLEGAHPWRASEMNATVRHAPHCYGDGTGGSSCADTYMDLPHDTGGMKQSDVEVDVDSIVPFMYKHNKGSPMLHVQRIARQAKAPLTMLAEKTTLGEEVMGGGDTKVSVSELKSGHGRWDKIVDRSSSDKISKLQEKSARTALAKVDKYKDLPVGEYRTHEETTCIPGGPCADEVLDGMKSNVVDVNKADCTTKEECDGRTWESYLFKHKKGGAMLAKRITKSLVPASKMEEASLDGMSDQMVQVKMGKVDDKVTLRWNKFYSPEGPKAAPAGRSQLKGAVAGDEIVDSTDNVHVETGKVGTGPHAGELQWDTFYSGKVVKGGAEAARKAGGKPTLDKDAKVDVGLQAVLAGKTVRTARVAGPQAYKVGGRVHMGMSDDAAQKDINSFWDKLDADPEHGGPKLF